MRIASLLLSLLLPLIVYAGPVVTSVNPASGPMNGGTVVQITGSGFSTVTAIHFGTVPATLYTVDSTTSITVTAPPTFVAGTIDVTVTTGSGTSPTTPADLYTYDQGNWYAYALVANAETIQPINISTEILVTPLSVFTVLNSMEILPDGQSALANSLDLDAIFPVDLATFQLLPQISGFYFPNFSISPDGTTAYFLNYSSSPFGIQPINIATGFLGTFIPFPSSPPGNAIALTPDGKKAYVFTFDNVVLPVDLTLGIVGAPISVPGNGGPSQSQIQITPDGTKAFVTNASGNYSTFIDLTTNIPYNVINIGEPTINLAINPNGQTVYFINASNQLVPIDVATLTGSPVPVFGVTSIAVVPDGMTAYCAIGDSIFTIDLTTYANLISYSGYDVTNIAISPDQAPIALFSVIPEVVGLPTLFDGTDSFSPVGTVVQYDWDFGDGNTLSTILPVAAHIYENPGTFTATLTVTNSAGTSTTQVYTGQMVNRNGGPSATTSQQVQIASLLPPANVKGFQRENKFFTQDEIENKIVWSAPSSGNQPVAYYIFRDPDLINLVDIVPANKKLEFVQHNVAELPYTYYITSRDAEGNQSSPVRVEILPSSD